MSVAARVATEMNVKVRYFVSSLSGFRFCIQYSNIPLLLYRYDSART